MSYPNIIENIESRLPKTGGTITGVLCCLNELSGGETNPDNTFDIRAMRDTSNGGSLGGSIRLFNKNRENFAGGFELQARTKTDTSDLHILRGTPDGVLTWSGADIITSNGGTIRNTLYYGGHDMYCDKDNDIIAIYGSTHHTIGGASLVLHGGIQSNEYGESNISAFKLTSKSYDTSVSKTLYGHYSKGLLWDNKEVICLVAHWQSGNRWYRKYSNGWIEQGGNWSTANTTLSFNTPFSNTNYTIVGSENQGDDNARAIKFNRNNATTTSIRMVGSANPIGVCWYACGF